MPFANIVEVGRFDVGNYGLEACGPENGKLVVISDIVDQNRCT